MEPNDPFNDVERRIREFLDGNLTAEQLCVDLQAIARRSDGGLPAFREVHIDWERVPQERLFEFFSASAKITGPVLEAFFKGQIPLEDAARRLAPFFLVVTGFGIDPPPDAGPDWIERRESLFQRILELGEHA